MNSAPTTLDTLNELATALNNDASFSTTITNLIGTKLASADFNSTFATRYAATSITSGLAPTSSLSMNNRKITNLATPTLNTDAATKAYVDSLGTITGEIKMWPSTTIPSGYLLCNGASYNTTTYAALFAVLGTSTLPDFRGRFARGFDPTKLRDPDTRTILSVQTDDYESHLHSVLTQTVTTTANGAHDHTLPREATSTSDGDGYEPGSGGNIDYTGVAGNHNHSVVIPT